jgi:uncharacterized membrane protein
MNVQLMVGLLGSSRLKSLDPWMVGWLAGWRARGFGTSLVTGTAPNSPLNSSLYAGQALYSRNPLEFCSANMVNSIINLYRAEVQTMTQYRMRLDTSTNWGVSLTAALTALGIGSQQLTSSFFL